MQALDVGIGVDARGVGVLRLPERGSVAKGYSVSTFAQRLGIRHSSNADIEDTRRQSVGRPGGSDLNIAGLLIIVRFFVSLAAPFFFWSRGAQKDTGEMGLGGKPSRRRRY